LPPKKKEKANVADTEMAGGALPDVLITEAVAVSLHAHLAEQGRNVGGAQDLALLLHRAVERSWGTNKAPRFNDEVGGGWIIDLTDYMDGEMLYAQIRTIHGRRTLVTVVEAEEYEAFARDGKWQTPMAANPEAALVDPEALKEAEAIEKGKALAPVPAPAPGAPRPAALPAPDPDDQMLVVLRAEKDVMPSSSDYHQCKRSEVPGMVQNLLMGEGITEENIEIWSNMTRPKVKVEF
jgi:hypothetical protein